MKIIAQSQTPTKVSYIHLAYVSAQLSNGISKGDFLPTQTILSAALAAAIACGAVGAKLGRNGKRVRAAIIGAMLGLTAMLFTFGIAHSIWSSGLSNEQVVNHIIQTGQWWALREPKFAVAVEAAAITNGSATCMAANYYYIKGESDTNLDFIVRAYKYAEDAAAKGYQARMVSTGDFTNYYRDLIPRFQTVLGNGKLTQAEQSWAKQKLLQMEEQSKKDDQAGSKKMVPSPGYSTVSPKPTETNTADAKSLIQ